MNQYLKQPLSIDNQLETLIHRGLTITDYDLAHEQLRKIGYFRLANYWKPMEADKNTHTFKPNSLFSNALDLYYFDKKLRIIIFSAIQSIEVAFRTKLMHEAAMEHGAFWILDKQLFANQKLAEVHLEKIQSEVKRSKEDFILEYFSKYDSPDIPPVWKTMEVLSFGTVSKLYQNLADKSLKKRIARSFGLPQDKMMESWIRPLAGLRNYIAHHSRVWNRNFPQMPQLPARLINPWIDCNGISNSKLYAQICCIKYLLDTIHPNNNLTSELKILFDRYRNVDIRAMGFQDTWLNQPLWQTRSSTAN